MEAKNLSSFVMMSTQGQQKGRMSSSSNIERHRGDAWNLLSVTTGNISIGEYISVKLEKSVHEAEAARVLEVPMLDINFESSEVRGDKTIEFERLMAENFGVAGPVFIQALLQAGEEKVSVAVAKMQKFVMQHYNMEQKHRHWTAQVACTLLACQICQKIGLLPYTLQDITKVAGDVIEMNKQAMVESKRDVKDIISEYVLENKGNMIVVDSGLDLRKGGAENTGMEGLTPSAMLDPNYKAVGRYEPDTNDLYLMVRPLKSYCVNRGIVYREVENELKNLYGAKVAKKRIDKGTYVKTGAVSVVIINQATWLDFQDAQNPIPNHQSRRA
jgi:hypothetical protein